MVNNSWNEIIKEIRGRFFDKGITDDLAILESLGFFLLAAYKEVIVENESPFEVNLEKTQDRLTQLFPNSELPHPTSFRGITVDKKHFFKTIVNSIKSVNFNELGSFYEYSIQHLITEMKTGGRYTTPRHITRFMGEIAGLGPDSSFADLACGSGGILLNAEKHNVRNVTGYEISPNWARIAFTNLTLHEIENITILVGDSFNLLSESNLFDVIMMNPPFGMKVNKNAQLSSPFGEYSSQSEIAFLQLGLDHLSEQGKLVTLLPSGFLFSTGKKLHFLKEKLIHNSVLRSVVTFPDDAFQPYSNIQTHLLEIQNENVPSENHLIWFYQPRYDGFTPGRNRKEDPDHNDLPLIQKAITWHKSKVQDKNKRSLFRVDFLNSDGNQGYRIAFDPNKIIYEQESIKKDYLLTTAQYGLAFNNQGFLFKWKDKERDVFSVIFNDETFHFNDDNLTTIGFSTALTQEFPKRDLQIIHKGLKGYFFSPKGIHENNEIRAQLEPLGFDLFHENPGYLCYLIQPDLGYFSQLMLMDNKDWMPKNLQPPCLLSVESADVIIDGDYPLFLLIWDSKKINVFPSTGNRGSMGYIRSLSSGEDLFFVQNKQSTDDYYFIFFDRERLRKLPKNTEGIVLDHEGTVLGVGVRKEVISENRYDLMPSTYISEEKEVEDVMLPPAYILGNIKKNQIELTRAVDDLLQFVEKKLLSDNQINKPKFPLLEYNNEELRSKWKELPENYFQLTDVKNLEIDQQSLDLLVSLGLLMKVELGDSIYYRHLENHDVHGKATHED